MALTGDRYLGRLEGHAIEIVRNNWNKSFMLLIDGRVVARKFYLLPRRITLTAVLEHNGTLRTIMARSVPRYLFWTVDTVAVDGVELSLTKTK